MTTDRPVDHDDPDWEPRLSLQLRRKQPIRPSMHVTSRLQVRISTPVRKENGGGFSMSFSKCPGKDCDEIAGISVIRVR